MSRCKFCGSSNFGHGCTYSPYAEKVHEHGPVGDYRRCVYCGSSSYGTGCNYSPEGKGGRGHTHKHFSDGIHCIYCGKQIRSRSDGGSGCVYSPTGYHSL